LQQKKYRTVFNRFVVEGEKMVVESIRQNTYPLKALFVLDNIAELPNVPDECKVYRVSAKELQRISHFKTAGYGVAELEIPENGGAAGWHAVDLILYLDGIRDPGNLGTILRTADWFGIKQVICSPDCVEIYNPKVIQSTMGAVFRVQTITMDYDTLVEFAHKQAIPMYGAFLTGQDVFRSELKKPAVLAIGSESHGISSALTQKIDEMLYIPGYSKGVGSESLNAAVAAGIMCAQFRAQR